ncbi:hypothetical protein SUGI_0735070 [Cryptomeria japonica]|uniref:uncharacterized protein LOC131041498 n=1 Tax=Cryptomeria japonica TaxID=3369 RepID=UPI002414B9C9|nr:uncharacterized protein LOC131041498 [Cryptomeria japonica]GLJ36571.1 hypothetical protein SUGI_0735070 [Cryptomeria japonica]
MAVLAQYWHGNLGSLPTVTMSYRSMCSGYIERYHKKMYMGSKQANWSHLQGVNKMKWRAVKGGGGFEEGIDDDNEEEEEEEEEEEKEEDEEDEEENLSFWERKETQDKMKELEDMRELIKDVEKFQTEEEGAAAEIKDEASTENQESEEERKARFREELAKRAKELAEKRKKAEVMFQMGQRAYGKGKYNKAVELLEGALSNVPEVSLVGGEIQLWLAMAYEAHNRHSDCIALYKFLENTHPIKAIRQKAAGLRFILEAPKLKITEEEMVSIPLMQSNYDSSKGSWSQTYRNRRTATISKETPRTKDYFVDFLVWKSPQWERNPIFWVAVAGWLTLVGVALVFQD